MSAVTLSQVAREAGVSLATASRVLNGSDRRPAEHIAERVRDAAESLGYVANAQAQALARSTTGLVGLVVHDIADPYFSSIAKGVQRRARTDRHQLLLAATDGTDQLDAVRGLTVVVGNDVMALGAIAGFRHAGLVVPDDLRVAGFDDIPNLRDFSPGLTTVRFPLEQIGETAADIALSHDQVRIEHVVGEIVRRESA